MEGRDCVAEHEEEAKGIDWRSSPLLLLQGMPTYRWGRSCEVGIAATSAVLVAAPATSPSLTKS